MTHEIGSWQGQTNLPQPFETNIPENEREKPVHLIEEAFDRMLDLATEHHGLQPVRAGIDDFDMTTLLEPGRHLPGRMREGLFEDALWMRKTIASRLNFSVQTLILFTDGRPHEFHVATLGKGEDSATPGRNFVGTEEMAASPTALHDLGKIESTFETEQRDRWPGVLTPGDLKYAYRPRVK